MDLNFGNRFMEGILLMAVLVLALVILYTGVFGITVDN